MRAFPEAVAAYKAGDLSDADLYRTIMAWPTWHVAAGPDDGDGATRLAVLRSTGGLRVMEIFSDQQALDEFLAREDAHLPERVVRLPGFHLFGSLADEAVQRVNLDLHSPQATHFFENQIPLLRAWAGVVEVELALAVPDRVGDPFGVLRRFDGYEVVIREPGGARELVMAPDDHDRALAAVFTADDVVDEFVAEAEAELDGTLVIERLDGATLFAQLAAMPLDGIVFNPLTHLPPVALGAGVIARVLEA